MVEDGLVGEMSRLNPYLRSLTAKYTQNFLASVWLLRKTRKASFGIYALNLVSLHLLVKLIFVFSFEPNHNRRRFFI